MPLFLNEYGYWLDIKSFESLNVLPNTFGSIQLIQKWNNWANYVVTHYHIRYLIQSQFLLDITIHIVPSQCQILLHKETAATYSLLSSPDKTSENTYIKF